MVVGLNGERKLKMPEALSLVVFEDGFQVTTYAYTVHPCIHTPMRWPQLLFPLHVAHYTVDTQRSPGQP